MTPILLSLPVLLALLWLMFALARKWRDEARWREMARSLPATRRKAPRIVLDGVTPIDAVTIGGCRYRPFDY